jgi:hypothetical protein
MNKRFNHKIVCPLAALNIIIVSNRLQIVDEQTPVTRGEYFPTHSAASSGK